MQRTTVSLKQLLQFFDDPLRRNTAGNIDRETLAGILVYHRHEFDLASILGRVKQEVEAPDMVRVACLEAEAAVLAGAQPATLSLCTGHLKARLLPQTVYALAVNLPAFSPKQFGNHAIAGPWVLL